MYDTRGRQVEATVYSLCRLREVRQSSLLCLHKLTFKTWKCGKEASTLEKSHSNSLYNVQLVNGYSEHLHLSLRHGSTQCMNIHEHTWTVLGCRPNSTCKADGLLPSWRPASPCVSNHVGVTTMERLDQGHLHPKLEVPGLTCLGRESNPGLWGRALYTRAIQTVC